jgi:hypothetical protein
MCQVLTVAGNGMPVDDGKAIIAALAAAKDVGKKFKA